MTRLITPALLAALLAACAPVATTTVDSVVEANLTRLEKRIYTPFGPGVETTTTSETFTKVESERMFAALDGDRDGAVSADEWKARYEAWPLALPDEDGDGRASAAEFEAFATRELPEENSDRGPADSDQDPRVEAVTAETFDAEVLEADTPVLVMFEAAWYAGCRHMRPVLDDFQEVAGTRWKVRTVNIDRDMSLAQGHGIMTLPTLVAFKDGREFDRIRGVVSPSMLKHRFGL